MMDNDEFDYIVVGAGSAGCVMATRLAERYRVLLIEAGRADAAWDFRLHMPAALSLVLKSTRYNWAFNSEPEAALRNRQLYCPRGKVLGGSSSINGMIFVRGNPEDFNRWEALGASGWAYEQVLPFFKRSETKLGGDPAFRGTEGPVHVTNGEIDSPLNQAWLQAGDTLGLGNSEDFNGRHQEGFGPFDRTVEDGLRQSAARGYLRRYAAEHAPGLKILTLSEVLGLEFKGDRAVGVRTWQRGQMQVYRASEEVIVSAGAIKSPQLLMLSGIGAESSLKSFDIPCISPIEAVGRNLQDHLEVYIQSACLEPVSIYPSTHGLKQLAVGMQWYLAKQGAGATNHFHTGAFLRSGLDLGYPDLQFHFLPVAMDYDGKAAHRGHGFQMHVGPMKPTSRGQVALKSKDPRAAPQITFNYNSTRQDQQVMARGIEIARAIAASSSFKGLTGRELRPGQVDVMSFVQDHGESAYHPCGTCRMGDDDGSVTDSQGVVRGVRGLRVVDASLMPEITNGNLNAVVLMMAEKISSSILQARPDRDHAV